MNLAAQDHFSGIKNSNSIGVLSSSVNPAELSNLTSKYDINVFSLSINASNNKIGFSDIVDGNNIEDIIFDGNEPVNMRIDAEIYGPGFAMKLNKWAFGFSTKMNMKLNLIDIDPELGKAISDNSLELIGYEILTNNYNQRINGTSWGEVNFSGSRTLFENEKHKFNAGATLKLLFPGSYTNFGVDKFNGKLSNVADEYYLSETNAQLNIAYSGNLSGGFTDFGDYSKTIFGNLNGLAADFGINYQLKDEESGYKLNAGAAVKNIGSMTFKDADNSSTDYTLNIPSDKALNLNEFEGVNSIKEVEEILESKGYLEVNSSNSNIKVKLPSLFAAYADIKVVPKFFVSLYTQQKIKKDNGNDQVTAQNIFAVTPRLSLKNFELYSTWAKNEVSGTTGGFGYRFYHVYMGSSSIVTALISNTKQADFYFGYRFRLK